MFRENFDDFEPIISINTKPVGRTSHTSMVESNSGRSVLQVGVWYIKKTLIGSAWYVRNETTKTWESDWEGKRETYAWNDHIWGAEKKEGLILIMLSSDAIRWLNEVATWLDSKEHMYGI